MTETAADQGSDGALEIPAPPPWLQDETDIIALLHKFLDALDRIELSQRSRPLKIRLTQQTHPWLFRYSDSNHLSWKLLRSLDQQVFTLRLKKNRNPYAAEYEDAQLSLLPQAEPLLRSWLQRPKSEPYFRQWQEAISTYAAALEAQNLNLAEPVLQITGWSADAIVQALIQIARHTPSHVTLRQLSARYFNGQSKVLDGREELISRLFPQLEILERPILIQAALPERLESVLFVENQDTYLQLLKQGPAALKHTGLVFSAGFRATALRIRTREGTCLHYAGPLDSRQQESFESWWYGHTEQEWKLYFWGDLDYSGMAILKLLRQRFPNVCAWKPGYDYLCNALLCEQGHAPAQADKEEQRDPQDTGCQYADEHLLPILRKHRRFVDQEIMPLDAY